MRRLLGSLAVVMAGLVGCDDDTSPVVVVDASVAGDGCVDCVVECPPASQVPEGFVCAPAGEFWMGSAADEFPRDPDEARHRVRVTRPFFVAVHEVTQAEWQAVVGNNPSYFQAGGDGGCEGGEGCEARPVERVTWFEAAAYLNRRSEQEGLDLCYEMVNCRGTLGEGCDDGTPDCLNGYRCDSVAWIDGCAGYRLPTEAEWEYAARAGSERATYGELDDIAWYVGNSRARTHRVGTRDANAWGIGDVYGNVLEWTWDIYAMNYGFFGRPEVAIEDPRGEDFGDTRVIRGGSWRAGYELARAAARDNAFPANRDASLGFRAVRSVPAE
ncbi:MAG: formylglycine-generating enzyme family protein [Myxococcales bacterium]|nr:formylglycine-generating enzyme family protein [Myxococcales bacterium]